MTHATPSPCVCGGKPQTRHFPVSLIRAPICYWVTCEKRACSAATPEFADEPTALRAWNAMQTAAREEGDGRAGK